MCDQLISSLSVNRGVFLPLQTYVQPACLVAMISPPSPLSVKPQLCALFFPCLENTPNTSHSTLMNTPRGLSVVVLTKKTCWQGGLLRIAQVFLPVDLAEEQASGDGVDQRLPAMLRHSLVRCFFAVDGCVSSLSGWRLAYAALFFIFVAYCVA